MLSIATIILWLITIFFMVTAVYSVVQLDLTIGEVYVSPSSDGINFFLPFSIINNGYYDLDNLNLTTHITDPDEKLSIHSNTLIPLIPQGTTLNATHRVLVDLDTITSIEHVPLLLNDSYFETEIFVSLNFARAIPIQVSTNTTIPWGAPLSHFSLGSISFSSFNSTHVQATMHVSFGNHATLNLIGTLKLEFYSDSQELLAYGESAINVSSQRDYNGEIRVYAKQEDLPKIPPRGNVQVTLETPMFVAEWEESYG